MKIKINTNTFLGISAMLISLGTLIVLIYQSKLMREHEEKSAIPKLELWNDLSESRYALRLENKGLGPALIEEVAVKYGDKIFYLDPMFFAINYADSANNEIRQITGTNLFEGIIITLGSKIKLVESTNELDDQMLRDLFYNYDTKVIIYYSSIYGKVWKLNGTGDLPNIQSDYEPKIFNELFSE
ncbi:hypothetical protein [Ekhidna sp.]